MDPEFTDSGYPVLKIICLCLLEHWDYRWASYMCSFFNVISEDMNSGPYDCEVMRYVLEPLSH